MVSSALRILSAAAVVAFASSAIAQTQVVTSGTTTIQISSAFGAYLHQNGVAVGPAVGSVSAGAGQISLPIAGGAADLNTDAAEIDHSGGLIFSAEGHSIVLTSFIVDTTNGNGMSALVIADGTLYGRQPLFSITPTQAPVIGTTNPKTLTLNGVTITLSQQAQEILSYEFGVSFDSNITLGTANISAFISTPSGVPPVSSSR